MRGHVIRFAVVSVVFALLYHFGFLQFKAMSALYDHPALIVGAGLLMFATIPVAAVRWHLLLRCQGFRLPLRKTLEVVLVGQFFNTFLPGSYGGDVVRAGYVYHGAGREIGTLLLSILVDRLTGLVGLVALAITVQLGMRALIDIRITGMMILLVAAAVLGATLLPTIARLVATVLKRLNGHLAERVLHIAGQIGDANAVYARRPGVLGGAIALSMLQFALALLSVVLMADAFAFVTISELTVAYASIVALIANSVPLTPGGLGVGEAAFANAIVLLDPSATGPYATIFLAVRGLTVLTNLTGGLVFLLYRNEVIEYVAEGRSLPERP